MQNFLVMTGVCIRVPARPPPRLRGTVGRRAQRGSRPHRSLERCPRSLLDRPPRRRLPRRAADDGVRDADRKNVGRQSRAA